MTELSKQIIQIRNQTRQIRRTLPLPIRQQAQQTIYKKIAQHEKVNLARNVAIFLSFDGELDTKPIIDYLWQQNKSVFLPIINPTSRHELLFVKYTAETPLITNKFGILEPKLDIDNLIPYQQLDIIFTPLVAFDHRGYRIGMGGGYYDRLLANYQQTNVYPIGLALQCQKIALVENQPWDVKLPEIIYA